MKGKPAKHVPPRVVATTFAAFALSVVALLLWGRIKLVAGVPRTAYAEPKLVAPPPKARPATPTPPIPIDRPDLRGD